MAHKMSKDIKSDSVYRDWLAKLKEKFRGVQIKAAVVSLTSRSNAFLNTGLSAKLAKGDARILYRASADFPRCWLGLNATIDIEAKAKELAVLRLRKDLGL